MSVKLISLIVSYQAETDTRKPVDFDDDGKQEEEMTRTHIHSKRITTLMPLHQVNEFKWEKLFKLAI